MASKKPTVDQAGHKAYFPSEYSLGQYVPPKTDSDGAKDAPRATAGQRKILTILTDERYLPMENDTYFSTGNHRITRFIQAWTYSFRIVPIIGRSRHLRTLMGLASLAAITIVLLITLMMAVMLIVHGA